MAKKKREREIMAEIFPNFAKQILRHEKYKENHTLV